MQDFKYSRAKTLAQAQSTLKAASEGKFLAGGQTLLVYDFGAFALDSNRKPTYPIPKSRLSDLAGVDYALYHTLREKSTVIGPIAVMRSTMRELQVPPGKSSPYVAVKNTSAVNATAVTDTATVLTDTAPSPS